MARFLLVHGAWQGAWCWQNVVPRLEAFGHSALALDLPGYGKDSARAASTTMSDYMACVREAIDISREAPLVVGHSAGGFVSQVSEAIPNRIRCLVFVAALVPANGCSMMQFVEQFDPEYTANFQWAPDGRSARLHPDGARKFLYSDCPAAIVDSLLPQLQVQSVAPYEYTFSLSAANFGTVPKCYVRTLHDRLTTPKLQDEICALHGIKSIYPLYADHSPFFSAPDELAATLHSIAQRV